MTRTTGASLLAGEPLDDLDAALFRLLQVDGRRGYRDMANELGVPEGTVRFRVNRLLREQIVHVAAWVHPQRLGGVLATVLLRVAPAQQRDVADALADTDCVMYISRCVGPRNLLLQLVVPSLSSLEAFVAERIGALDGILDVETIVETDVVKALYGTSAAVQSRDLRSSASASP